MKIELMHTQGIEPALMGVGLSYGLTSEYSYLRFVPEETKSLIEDAYAKIAARTSSCARSSIGGT